MVTREAARRIPERVKLADILLLGVATQKVSWLVSTDVVTYPGNSTLVAGGGGTKSVYEQPYWIASLAASELKERGLSCEGPTLRGETMSAWECKGSSGESDASYEVSIVHSGFLRSSEPQR